MDEGKRQPTMTTTAATTKKSDIKKRIEIKRNKTMTTQPNQEKKGKNINKMTIRNDSNKKDDEYHKKNSLVYIKRSYIAKECLSYTIRTKKLLKQRNARKTVKKKHERNNAICLCLISMCRIKS